MIDRGHALPMVAQAQQLGSAAEAYASVPEARTGIDRYIRLYNAAQPLLAAA